MTLLNLHGRQYRASIMYIDADGMVCHTAHDFEFNSNAHKTPEGQGWAYANSRYGKHLRGCVVTLKQFNTSKAGVHVQSMEG